MNTLELLKSINPEISDEVYNKAIDRYDIRKDGNGLNIIEPQFIGFCSLSFKLEATETVLEFITDAFSLKLFLNVKMTHITIFTI